MEQKKIIPILLVGLPVGLLLLGVGSMFYTEVLDDTPAGHARDEAKERNREIEAVLQRPVTEQDLRRYVSSLSDKIGERNRMRSGALKAAAFFVESSMGPSNMGYATRRQIVGVGSGEEEFRNIEAELKGQKLAAEVVVVAAAYDSAEGSPGANGNATGVAAMLAIANAFVGTENQRTLRFVGYLKNAAEESSSHPDGLDSYVNERLESGENVVAVLVLDSLGFYTEAPESQNFPPEVAKNYAARGNFLALAGTPGADAVLEDVYRGFRTVSKFPLEKLAAFPDGTGVPALDWLDVDGGNRASRVPFVAVTDTSSFRYPDYEAAGDKLDRIDFTRFTEVVKGIESAVIRLVNP